MIQVTWTLALDKVDQYGCAFMPEAINSIQEQLGKEPPTFTHGISLREQLACSQEPLEFHHGVPKAKDYVELPPDYTHLAFNNGCEHRWCPPGVAGFLGYHCDKCGNSITFREIATTRSLHA